MTAEQEKKARWYAVHTYSGYENTVKRNLLQRVEALNMTDKIFEVLIPEERQIILRGEKKVEKKESVYPGYVLVKMIADQDSWFVVRNTPRVTGFVGAGTDPVPLSEEEVSKILSYKEEGPVNYQSEFSKGDLVKVIDGPFKDTEGRINEILEEEFRVSVLVPMFGRETAITLDFAQIRKV